MGKRAVVAFTVLLLCIPLLLAQGKNPPPQLVITKVVINMEGDPPTMTIYIYGRNFGELMGKVLIGNEQGDGVPFGFVDVWTDNEIVVQVDPPLATANYLLIVLKGSGATQIDSMDIAVEGVPPCQDLGLVDCSGSCVDLDTDPGNCGACGTACDAGEICDGGICESGSCSDGTTQPCYTGDPGTLGVGQCTAGIETCTSGAWGACVGEILPGPEICNNIDDDCDGANDENLVLGPCDGPDSDQCMNGTYQCVAGSEVCEESGPGIVEICDGIDNDCDGMTDAITQSCYTGPLGTEGVGACITGTETCTVGAWGACVGEILPTPEICDGVDNDCNGTADGITQSCYTGDPGTLGVGQCTGGEEMCSGGAWGACVGEVLPNPEICDGADNDCNGTADERFDLDSDPANCGACGNVCPDDGHDCTEAICVGGVCDHQPTAGKCFIDSTCYSDGQVDPGNASNCCDPSTDQNGWTACPS